MIDNNEPRASDQEDLSGLPAPNLKDELQGETTENSRSAFGEKPEIAEGGAPSEEASSSNPVEQDPSPEQEISSGQTLSDAGSVDRSQGDQSSTGAAVVNPQGVDSQGADAHSQVSLEKRDDVEQLSSATDSVAATDDGLSTDSPSTNIAESVSAVKPSGTGTSVPPTDGADSEVAPEKAGVDKGSEQDTDTQPAYQKGTEDSGNARRGGGIPGGWEEFVPEPPEEAKPRVSLAPNAKVGEPYFGSLVDSSLTVIGDATEFAPQWLKFEPNTQQFFGTPEEADDVAFEVWVSRGGSSFVVRASLAVLPDPKSMWKNQPSDQKSRFWKEDEYYEEWSTDQLLVVGASKRGRSHAHEGTCRDDHFGFTSNDGWYIGAVADGAGSAEYSREGSKQAVKAILKELPRLLAEEISSEELERWVALLQDGDDHVQGSIKIALYDTLVTAAFTAAQRIEKEVVRDAGEGAHYSQFSTTIICAIARQVNDKWFFGSFSVGDGGAAVLYETSTGDTAITRLTQPDSGEYAGQTIFLRTTELKDANESMKRIFFDVRDEFTALALMTDGITDPKFETDAVFDDPKAWAAFWTEFTEAVPLGSAEETRGTEFLEWLDFWSPGNHDDRTLLLMIPGRAQQ
jgi:serine/threonine protein phosphatase PrpC